MTKNDILAEVAKIHNIITDIAVKSDDAIRMGEAIKECRALYRILQQDIAAESGAVASTEEK